MLLVKQIYKHGNTHTDTLYGCRQTDRQAIVSLVVQFSLISLPHVSMGLAKYFRLRSELHIVVFAVAIVKVLVATFIIATTTTAIHNSDLSLYYLAFKLGSFLSLAMHAEFANHPSH